MEGMFDGTEYKEGNNRPSSVNQISLVHNHDKAGEENMLSTGKFSIYNTHDSFFIIFIVLESVLYLTK